MGTRSFDAIPLTQAIMQTTLFDFACVLAIPLVFIARDAKEHGLAWWWILPMFPFMPTVGLLLYFIVRRQKMLALASKRSG